ncbi:DUF6783 domain-containing protein [Ruminococcus sp. 1001136sp1]|uniref:DUF6783 domain-containing protein n=1 Tax=Ruminococcus sp. 1001136sp1 TaxID=2986996 RepID=UPI003FA7C583
MPVRTKYTAQQGVQIAGMIFKQALSNVCNCRHDGQLRFFQYSISKVSAAIMHFPCFFTTFR